MTYCLHFQISYVNVLIIIMIMMFLYYRYDADLINLLFYRINGIELELLEFLSYTYNDTDSLQNAWLSRIKNGFAMYLLIWEVGILSIFKNRLR